MRKILLASVAALAFAVPASAGNGQLTVIMKDPGCHWFKVGGKLLKTVAHSGPVRLVNYDEAALKIKGPGGTKLERVGAKLKLTAKGIYKIKMVGQHPHDNTLTLKIK